MRQCHFTLHQATDGRGRVAGKVRHGPLGLRVDVPEDDELLAWAAAPFKPLAGQVVFFDLAAQVPHETIAFAAGQCVGYAEAFASAATGAGAYVCQLTITAPAFELRAGGPAAPLAAAVRNWAGAGVPTGEMEASAKQTGDGWGDTLLDWIAGNPTHPIADPAKLASLRRSLKAQKELLINRQTCLKWWATEDQACFNKVFGTTSETARQTILKRVERQLTHVDNMLNKDAYATKVFSATPVKANEYAHVRPGDERHHIYLNQKFWTSALKGTDSKAGALAHEMSHFDDLGDTDDVVYGGQKMYGVSNAKVLAARAPDLALKNADNYEYYLEGAICP